MPEADTGASTADLSDKFVTTINAATLLDAAPDAFLIVDGDGRICLTNAGAPAMFGYAGDELIGVSVDELVPRTIRADHVNRRAEYGEHPEARPLGAGLQLRAERADGSMFPVDISLCPARFDGEDYVVAAVRDLTETLATRDELQRVQEDSLLIRERERVARDLHDTVIQSVFAIGLGLQSVSNRIQDQAVATRVHQSIDDLDRVIRDIRTAIFGLTTHQDWGRGLRGELLRIAAEERIALGFEPTMEFIGPIDDADPEIGEQLLPALREALSNVAKHANAKRCDVTVIVDGESLELRVLDDGVGPDEPITDRGRGLANVTDRARQLGGSCSFGPAPIAGACLEWIVPLDHSALEGAPQ